MFKTQMSRWLVSL